jgi:hypothetical protein
MQIFLDKTKATVFYFDYGNCEEIKLDNMRFLIEKFIKKYPVLATPISIANVSNFIYLVFGFLKINLFYLIRSVPTIRKIGLKVW